ncbi:hypothetical protein [Teredinibacter haidensis]|uniref:hypothetical protein n=1 Tax=Teredinibacter haidensis TaxID=2731755 RepID=UPI000948ECC8|nr:hypothetical protein [Teredinibacter haidensis]
MKYIFAIFLILFASYSITEKKSVPVYGYVRDGNFHPVLSVENNQFKVLAGSHSSIPKGIEPLFIRDSVNTLEISGSENYQDVLGEDKVGTLGKISSEEKPDTFFYKSIDSAAVNSSNNQSKNMSFYSFFSRNEWGRHFINKNQLSLSLENIAKESGVFIHAITDIDENGRNEVWVSYKLMYGEIGAMIYQEEEKEEWKLLVNHCFWCD